MVAFTRFLVFILHLLSHVYASNDESKSQALEWIEAERPVRWLEGGRSVLVYLATPDLYFWNQRAQFATQYPGAFIFNFTLTRDKLTLLLNDVPILPRAHPHIPAPLRAHQTGDSVSYFAQRAGTNFSAGQLMDLDYYIDTPDTTSGTSIYNTKYNPRVRIDILRASIPTYPGYSTPLSSDLQKQIWVYLDDLAEHPPNTPYSTIPLKIKRVAVDRRWRSADSPDTDTYKTLNSLKTCHIWSWLCADIKEYPYYQYIYRENFDQYGKKGSMRHFLTTRWASLVGLVGDGQAISLLSVCLSIALLLALYAVFRGMKCAVRVYQERVQEVDEWLADEEIEDEVTEGLLTNDRYFDDIEEGEKEKLSKWKGGEKIIVEESLSPPPPYVPSKTEKSLTS